MDEGAGRGPQMGAPSGPGDDLGSARRAARSPRPDTAEESFRRLAENAPDVIFRVRLRPQLAFDYVSPSVTRLTGHPPQAFYASFDRALRVVHRDDRQRFMAALRAPEAHPVDSVRLLRTDRALAWAEQRLVPIRDSLGSIVAVEGVLRDVTAHHRADERLAAVTEIAEAILEGQAPAETLRLIARHARAIVDADQALVLVEDSTRGSMEVAVVEGEGGGPMPGAEVRSGPLSRRVLRSGGSAIVEDLAELLEGKARAPALARGSAIVAALAARDRSLGLLVVTRRSRPGRLGELERQVVETFAHQAAIALEHGRAREVMSRLAILEDRTRIARELHDGVVQGLFGLGMALQAITARAEETAFVRDRLAREATFLDRLIEDLRNYIFELRPEAAGEQGLAQALALLAQRFEERYALRVVTQIDRQAAAALERDASQVLQMAREVLSNVGRHATARSCRLELRQDPDRITLEVADDGVGMPPRLGREPGRHGGLANVRERAGALGGRVRVTGRPGGGTTVRVVFPGVSAFR
ncbi:MAG: ATP-binding protein [Candidatus Dormibacteraceae bacterium]